MVRAGTCLPSLRLCSGTGRHRRFVLACVFGRLSGRLIHEFGEEMFDLMREQVSVELAMREFELTSSRAPFTESPGRSPSKLYFPEAGIKSPEHKAGGQRNLPPRNLTGQMDAQLDDFLLEYVAFGLLAFFGRACGVCEHCLDGQHGNVDLALLDVRGVVCAQVPAGN